MTSDIENFYDALLYQGMNSIIIGDGKTLAISHICTVKLKTPHGILILKNTLCIPKMKKHLISIQHLSKDLNYEFIMNAHGFCG